jgi:hypothetical protein
MVGAGQFGVDDPQTISIVTAIFLVAAALLCASRLS